MNRKSFSLRAPMFRQQLGSNTAWPSSDYQSLSQSGYHNNPIVYGCIRLITSQAACIPLQLSDNGKNVTHHPLLSLLQNPNRIHHQQSFLETLYSYLLIAGNAYIQKITPPHSTTPQELHLLRPDRVQIHLDSTGWPAGYAYCLSHQTKPQILSNDQIIHLRTFAPLDDHYGQSPLVAARQSLNIHNSANQFQQRLLENAARPSGCLIYNQNNGFNSQPLTDEQFQRLREELIDSYSGMQNAGRPMLLEGGLDWKPMSFSPADMEFLSMRHSAARDIALVFGVPPMLLGIPGDNTYSNYQEAMRALIRQTILPLIDSCIAGLQKDLVPNYSDRLSLSYKTDNLPAFLPEREAHWQRIMQADFLTVNEKRQALGYDTLPEGNRIASETS